MHVYMNDTFLLSFYPSGTCHNYYDFQFDVFVEFLSMKKNKGVSVSFLWLLLGSLPSVGLFFSLSIVVVFVLSYYIIYHFIITPLYFLFSVRDSKEVDAHWMREEIWRGIGRDEGGTAIKIYWENINFK